MKSIGEMLSKARDERNLTLDQAVHETNISRHYLVSLENEEFDAFPAEAYLLGFLRNYSEFLGLDPDKSVSLYKNYKLSEQPAPLEQLVGPPRGTTAKKFVPWVVLALAVIAAGVFFGPRLVSALAERRDAEPEEVVEEAPPAKEIVPAPPVWEGEIRPGDLLVLEDGNDTMRLPIYSDTGRMILGEPGGDSGPWPLTLGDELYLPNAEGRPAWRLYLKDFGLPGGAGVLEVQVLERPVIELAEAPMEIVAPPSGESDRAKRSQVILSAEEPEPFTLDVIFRGFSFFRYQQRNVPAREGYYSEGETLRLEVNSSVTVGLSDAGALAARIGGQEISLGRRGEVTVARIQWNQNEETEAYDLVLIYLY